MPSELHIWQGHSRLDRRTHRRIWHQVLSFGTGGSDPQIRPGCFMGCLPGLSFLSNPIIKSRHWILKEVQTSEFHRCCSAAIFLHMSSARVLPRCVGPQGTTRGPWTTPHGLFPPTRDTHRVVGHGSQATYHWSKASPAPSPQPHPHPSSSTHPTPTTQHGKRFLGNDVGYSMLNRALIYPHRLSK